MFLQDCHQRSSAFRRSLNHHFDFDQSTFHTSHQTFWQSAEREHLSHPPTVEEETAPPLPRGSGPTVRDCKASPGSPVTSMDAGRRMAMGVAVLSACTCACLRCAATIPTPPPPKNSQMASAAVSTAKRCPQSFTGDGDVRGRQLHSIMTAG